MGNDKQKKQEAQGGIWGWVRTIVDVARRFMEMDKRIEALSSKLTDSMRTQAMLVGILLRLNNSQTSGDEKKELIRELLALNEKMITDSLKREADLLNPLTEPELGRLRQYIEKVKGGGWLTAPEARDFNELAKRIDEDRRAKGEVDVGAVILAGIAGVVLGIIIGSSIKE